MAMDAVALQSLHCLGKGEVRRLLLNGRAVIAVEVPALSGLDIANIDPLAVDYFQYPDATLQPWRSMH
jgi:hypothetical protein